MIRLAHYTLAAAMIGAAALSAPIDPEDIFTFDAFSGPFGVPCVKPEDLDRIWPLMWASEGYAKSADIPRTCLAPDAPLSRAILAAAMGVENVLDLDRKDWEWHKVTVYRVRHPDQTFIVRPPDPVPHVPAVPAPAPFVLLLTAAAALFGWRKWR